MYFKPNQTEPNRTKHFFGLGSILISVFVWLMVSSCIEEEYEQLAEPVNSEILAAKTWYESVEAQSSGTENARKVKNGKGKPDWAKSKIYNQSDGKRVIEVQFDFEEISIPEHLKTEKLEKNSVLQTLILFPKPNGSYVSYFLNIFPDSPEKKFSIEDFIEGGYQKVPSDFSGVYRFYKWNGNFIGGWRIKDGKKTHRIKEGKLPVKNSSNNRISNFTITCYQVYTTWYQYSCSATGGCTNPVAIGETIDGYECEMVMAGPTTGGDGGGGGGSPDGSNEECEQPEGNILDLPVECEDGEAELFQIENNVRNICIRGPVQQAMTQDFQTQISDIIQSTFGESENFNVEIFDVANLPSNIDGQTDGYSAGNNFYITINLNRNTLSTASKEYIMATVFHEFLHAYFDVIGTDISGNTPEHQLMATEYLDMLSQSLVNAFGISWTDAQYLSWGGLQETVAYGQLPGFMVNGTNSTSGILYTNYVYKSGVKGTICDPLF